MPRKLRVQYHGAMYHVMNRGDQREDIFQDDKDRRVFASTLGEACRKTEWQVHAYCLMSNHFCVLHSSPQSSFPCLAFPRLPIRGSSFREISMSELP
jgi:REP element-mobilizing transposase RayT